MLPRWWVGGCWPRESRDGEGRLEDGTRTGQGHEHWACWEPPEGGWQGGAGGHGQASGQVGTASHGGRASDAGMACWPGEQEDEGPGGQRGAPSWAPRKEAAHMPTARTLRATCEEGRGLRAGCPGEGQHTGPGGWPQCVTEEPRGLGVYGAILSSALARHAFEAAQGGLWKKDSHPRTIGVGVRHPSCSRGLGTLGAGAPLSTPLAWGSPPSLASPRPLLASPWQAPGVPRWCRESVSATSQPGSQEVPILSPGRPRPLRAVPTAAPLQRPRPEAVVQGMSTCPQSLLD